jgi:hypothetical protein
MCGDLQTSGGYGYQKNMGTQIGTSLLLLYAFVSLKIYSYDNFCRGKWFSEKIEQNICWLEWKLFHTSDVLYLS